MSKGRKYHDPPEPFLATEQWLKRISQQLDTLIEQGADKPEESPASSEKKPVEITEPAPASTAKATSTSSAPAKATTASATAAKPAPSRSTTAATAKK